MEKGLIKIIVSTKKLNNEQSVSDVSIEIDNVSPSDMSTGCVALIKAISEEMSLKCEMPVEQSTKKVLHFIIDQLADNNDIENNINSLFQ